MSFMYFFQNEKIDNLERKVKRLEKNVNGENYM